MFYENIELRMQLHKHGKERLCNEMKMERILTLLLVAFMIAKITILFNANRIQNKFKLNNNLINVKTKKIQLNC